MISVTPSLTSQLLAAEQIFSPLSASLINWHLAPKSILAPHRPLLSTRNEFLWTPNHDEAFLRAKQLLTTAPVLAYFDASRETHLHTDASTLGLGFLLQKSTEDDSDWKVVQAGS